MPHYEAHSLTSARHGSGEGVGGQRGGTNARGGLEMTEGEGMSSAGPTSRARAGPGEEEEEKEESRATRFELSSSPKGTLRLDEAAPSPGAVARGGDPQSKIAREARLAS